MSAAASSTIICLSDRLFDLCLPHFESRGRHYTEMQWRGDREMLQVPEAQEWAPQAGEPCGSNSAFVT